MSEFTPEFLKELAEKQKLAEDEGKQVSAPLSTSAQTDSSSLDSIKKEAPLSSSSKDQQKPPLNGPVITYATDGVTIKKITPYKNGIIEGVVKTVHPNGQLESITPYINGKKQGEQLFYDEEGILMSTFSYVDDKLDGPVKIINNEGTLIVHMVYKDGKLNGPYIEYDKGIPHKISIYENDKLTQIQLCDDSGNIIQTKDTPAPF